MFFEYILNPFLKVAEKFGTRNAFCINEKFYSYNNFVQNISKIRDLLQNLKLGNTNIGLIANDDIETYASIFAFWLEGFAYVPLHPGQPVERNLEIINQAKIDTIISSAKSIQFPSVKTIESTSLKFKKLILQPKITSDDALAYILFTSGSTGKPKGVPISRGNIGNFIKSFWEVGIQIDKNDRCLQCFDLTFDVSVQSFLVSITKGACAYTIPHDQIKYSYIFGLFEDHKLHLSCI